MNLASEIRAEIARQGITRNELSEKLGISRQQLWNLLKDNGRPIKDFELKEISEVLNVRPHELMLRAEQRAEQEKE